MLSQHQLYLGLRKQYEIPINIENLKGNINIPLITKEYVNP